MSIDTVEGVGVPDGLVEERRNLDRKSLRANSSHDLVRESNVVAVVGGVEVLTVPAAGEHELKANTVGTL